MFVRFFKYMICTSAMLLPFACGDNEQGLSEQEIIEQEATNKAALNQQIFDEQVVGFGWRDYRMYRIDPITGQMEKNDVLGRDMDEDLGIGGGWYEGWYFDTSSLTVYFDRDDIPAYGFNKMGLTFDKENNAIFCDGTKSVETGLPIPSFEIESVEGDTLKAKFLYGTKRVDSKVYDYYAYGVFVRLSTDELKKIQELFTTDLDQIDENM